MRTLQHPAHEDVGNILQYERVQLDPAITRQSYATARISASARMVSLVGESLTSN